MGFESIRTYLQLASGLSDLTRARAMEAAQGLLTLPASSMATGTKMASQASALADELLAAATANRSTITTLVRDEVDLAMSRLGLAPVQKLEEVQEEAKRLRDEVARLRAASPTAAAPTGTVRKAAVPRSTVKKAAAPKSTAKKAAAGKSTVRKAAATPTTSGTARSAVTTRGKTTDT